MVKLDVSVLRYLTREHFRVLTSIEMGMKNHELVPTQLIHSIAQLKHGGAAKAIAAVHKHKLVYHERQVYDGYKLTYAGYDYLSLHTLTKRDILSSLGNQIGMGKESDVYIGAGPEGAEYAVKLHRLGRTSFRTVKKNRDYLRNRRTSSWLYLSRLAALKEFAFMKVLYEHKFPVPRPIDVNRHVVVMELLQHHVPLSQIRELRDPPALFSKLMELLVRLAEAGLIHGDFNEFNLLIHEDTEEPVIIDFPQMVSINHANAAELFARDVNCLVAYFLKRFRFQAAEFPQFEKDVNRTQSLDVEVEASGFSKEQAQEFDELLQAQVEDSSDDDSNGDSHSQDSDGDTGDGLSADDDDDASSSGSGSRDDIDNAAQVDGNIQAAVTPSAPSDRSQKQKADPAIPQEHIIKQQDADGDADLDPDAAYDGSDRRLVAQRVRAQLQRKRQRQKVATRNNYKGREKRKLQEEANSWASEKSFGW